MCIRDRRNTISFSNESLTEITCHAKGAYKINPNTKTIIDIGGQDSKVITLNEDGSIKSFVMNDKCAAGTGRFLEMMCKTLELTIDEMSKAGLNWKKDITISSMCTVFAESEVISLIADNNIDSDIIHGLNKSVASKTKSLIYRINGEPPYMMTGGVARNIGVDVYKRQSLNPAVTKAFFKSIILSLSSAKFSAVSVSPT